VSCWRRRRTLSVASSLQGTRAGSCLASTLHALLALRPSLDPPEHPAIHHEADGLDEPGAVAQRVADAWTMVRAIPAEQARARAVQPLDHESPADTHPRKPTRPARRRQPGCRRVARGRGRPRRMRPGEAGPWGGAGRGRRPPALPLRVDGGGVLDVAPREVLQELERVEAPRPWPTCAIHGQTATAGASTVMACRNCHRGRGTSASPGKWRRISSAVAPQRVRRPRSRGVASAHPIWAAPSRFSSKPVPSPLNARLAPRRVVPITGASS